jgi:sugar/nucleoside kinase (ribokinase family)
MGEILVEIMRPKAGMQLYQAGEFWGPYPSGAPAIFIDTAARLGCTAGIIGAVGEDDFGRCVLERLNADGVDCRYIRSISHKSTAVAFVTYFLDGSRKFIFHIDQTAAAMASLPAEEQIEQPAYFHIMGCSLMVNENFREAILQAMLCFHTWGAKISFDPNIRPELLGDKSLNQMVGPVLEKCAVLLPGTAELALLAGHAAESQAVKSLFDAYPLEVVALKRGKQGGTIYHRPGQTHSGAGANQSVDGGLETIEIPVYPVSEVDPTGSGDCFDAAFLCGLLKKKPLVECGRVASAAGALNAAAFGPMEGKISSDSIAQTIKTGRVI